MLLRLYLFTGAETVQYFRSIAILIDWVKSDMRTREKNYNPKFDLTQV